MASRKRNVWLEADESDDDDRGYESEEESRARMVPSAKRQKVEHDSEEEGEHEADQHEDFDDDDDDDEAEEPDDEDITNDIPKNSELAHLEKLAAGLPANLKLQSTKLGKPVPLSQPKKDKSGVIYLSRVPPFMKPTVLRSLLTPYGAVGKIFLTPEPAASRTQRLRGGGTKRKLYLDGWVEFLHKRDAKFVADNLNAQTMGGKKRGRWHDEVWNIKYLTGIKWNHLVETIQNENAERAARLRVEISRGKSENKAFLENLEMGKMISGIEAKKKEKEDREDDVGGEKATERVAAKKAKRPMREFVQHGVTTKGAKKPEPGQDVNRVLTSMM